MPVYAALLLMPNVKKILSQIYPSNVMQDSLKQKNLGQYFYIKSTESARKRLQTIGSSSGSIP